MQNKVVKVNIGSGPVGKDSWINLDWGVLPFASKIPGFNWILVKLGLLDDRYQIRWPRSLRLHDCRKSLPFANSCVDFIYTSHFLEHLYRYEAINLLHECMRVLKPGGILRVVVPDLELLASKYIARDRRFLERFWDDQDPQMQSVADLFQVHFYGYHCEQKPKGLVGQLQRRFIRGHLWMYDFESLNALMASVGFTDICSYSAGEGRVPDLGHLDIHAEASIHVEACKRALAN